MSERSRVFNSSQRKDVRRAEKAAQIEKAGSRDVVRLLTSTNTGRAWLWSQLVAAHIFEPSFMGDVNQALFRDGERNSGLRLISEIMEYSPEMYPIMAQEAQDRDGSAAATGTDERDPDDPADDERDSAPDDYSTGARTIRID